MADIRIVHRFHHGDNNALGIRTVISDTGELPRTGGAKRVSLLTATVPGVLTASLLSAATFGKNDASFSTASIATTRLTVGGNTITADVLRSQAGADCRVQTGANVFGSSTIANLVVNGTPITATGARNQTITLPGGLRIIINEQMRSPGAINVTALRVIVGGITPTPLADVKISRSHADIVCPG